MKNPNKEMYNAKTFFSTNEKRVSDMLNNLGDDISKKIFSSEIKYRCTHDKKDRPEYNRKNQYFPQDLITLKDDEVFIDCGAATWNEKTILTFKDGFGSGSKVSIYGGGGGKQIPGESIDGVQICSDASFIKMDIESAEYNALLGAYKTISNNRPVLAICIYHSDEDMIRIYELLNSWNLNYRFYVRKHAQKTSETVLYALPQ